MAVCGAGYWSKLQIPAWLETNEVEIVALYNRTYEKGLIVAGMFGIPRVYDDAEKMMSNEQIDFIDIITEAPGHEWLTLLASKHNIPVICQKPMAHTLESCIKMKTECEKTGVPFYIHENYRWQLHFRFVKNAIVTKRVGNLIRARIQMYTGGVDGWAVQPYLSTLKHMALIDAGPHILDLVRFMFGEIDSVYAVTLKTFSGCVGEDTAVILVKTGKVPIVCEICEHCDSKVFVECTNGSIIIDNDNIAHISIKGESVESVDTKNYQRYKFASDSDWDLHGGASIHSIIECNRSFISAFKSGKPPETIASDNLITMRAVFASIRSVEENRTVFIDEMDK